MKQILADFLKHHMGYLEFADELSIKALSATSYFIYGDDCRLGKWVEHYQQDFIDLGKQNNFDIHVLIEQMEELDTSPGVYVIISKKGDKSGLREVAKIEKGREGVFISEIDSIPNFDDFIKRSALNKMLLEVATDVVEVHGYKSKLEADSSYCSIGWLLDDEKDSTIENIELPATPNASNSEDLHLYHNHSTGESEENDIIITDKPLCVSIDSRLRKKLDIAEQNGVIVYNSSRKGYDKGQFASLSLVAYLCGKIFCGDYTMEGEWMSGSRFTEAKRCEFLFGFDVAGTRRSARGKGGGKSPVGYEKIDDLF